MTSSRSPLSTGSNMLNAARRRRELDELADRGEIDVLVIGGGVTGTGAALDAASRGLSVALVEKHDLAFGTSRWSSKLVHGGLRYLASGNVGIARESAVERGILLERTAPHLVRPLPQMVPLLPAVSSKQAAVVRAGFLAGDALRASAGTSGRRLPRSRRVPRAEALRLAPTLSQRGLRAAMIAWDGQLIDDARLVITVARTAAAHGARILTRCAAEQVTGRGAVLRDRETGGNTGPSFELSARAVINAAGTWSGDIAPDIALRPSRGTHLVLPDSAFGELGAGLTIPVPGEIARFVFALPAGGGRVHVGLTDEEISGPIPDIPQAEEHEIDFLLETVNSVLSAPIRREDVLGTYSGLRPLLGADTGRSAELSRGHAVLTGQDGLVSVVGGKLTTYRKMAEEAVDAAARAAGIDAGECRTAQLPLTGAAGPARLSSMDAPARLVSKYGAQAPLVLAQADGDPAALEPIADGFETTPAELRFGLRHEGALDEDDLLDRRTRIGLVDDDRARAVEHARAAVEHG